MAEVETKIYIAEGHIYLRQEDQTTHWDLVKLTPSQAREVAKILVTLAEVEESR